MNKEEKRCDYCGKPIGEAGKIYIAGTICRGHNLSLWQYIIYKIKNLIKQ